jgi:hypothetical protein
MSNRLKSALIVAATLVLGILVGAVAVGALHHRRINRIRELRDRDGIASVIRRQVRPSPEQREPLRAILRTYEPRLSQMRQSHREEMERVLDSLADELDDVLTPAQMQRLRRNGPPPPGEPGMRRGRGERRGGKHRERDGDMPAGPPPEPPPEPE